MGKKVDYQYLSFIKTSNDYKLAPLIFGVENESEKIFHRSTKTTNKQTTIK